MLAIAPRNNNDHVNNASGNHVLAPAAINKQKWKATMNKYERSVTTTLQNRGLKTGSPTSPMNRATSKNSSCNRCWEQRDRIFKALEPDGLGESNSL